MEMICSFTLIPESSVLCLQTLNDKISRKVNIVETTVVYTVVRILHILTAQDRKKREKLLELTDLG